MILMIMMMIIIIWWYFSTCNTLKRFPKFKKETKIKRNYLSDKFYNMLYYYSGVQIELITKISCDNADILNVKKSSNWEYD